MSGAAFEETLFHRVRPSGRLVGAIPLGALAAAALAGYLLWNAIPVAVGFCVLPLLVWLFGQPRLLLLLLGLSVPITYSLTAGTSQVNVAPSDLLLVLAGALIVVHAVTHRTSVLRGSLRPVKYPVVQYSALLLLLTFVHFSSKDVLQTAQRFELFLLPLVIGAFAATTRRENALLVGYLISTTVLALVWPFANVLGQKNPVGQMIANAILLLVAVPDLRRYAMTAFVLVPGLILTGSRGAIGAAVVGVIAVLALQESRMRPLLTRVVVVASLALTTYAMLPVTLQDRLTTLSPGKGSQGAYALAIRRQYAADARQLIKNHPFLGVGVGNYETGSPADLTATTDPHDVLLLEAAEGGYAFAASFIALIAMTVIAVWRMKSLRLAPAAVGVLAATCVHGLVDVYWVRGTPLLGWLLVGMACGELARVQRGRSVDAVD